MNYETVKGKIEEWLRPELEERNLYLVEIKFPMGRQIDVYIDSDTGVQISECATISRLLEKKLDESGLVPDNYILEVSSPGMTNPLKLPRQYKRRIGSVLEVVKTDGTQLEGELVEAEEGQIKLRQVAEVKKGKKPGAKKKESEEPKEYVVKMEEIKRAVVQLKF
jgi:ribosome maturation factor RimP